MPLYINGEIANISLAQLVAEGNEIIERENLPPTKFDPDLLTLLSYGRLANVYLDVLVDDELDLPEDASPCGPL